jgi:hypothetical protein
MSVKGNIVEAKIKHTHAVAKYMDACDMFQDTGKGMDQMLSAYRDLKKAHVEFLKSGWNRSSQEKMKEAPRFVPWALFCYMPTKGKSTLPKSPSPEPGLLEP